MLVASPGRYCGVKWFNAGRLGSSGTNCDDAVDDGGGRGNEKPREPVTPAPRGPQALEFQVTPVCRADRLSSTSFGIKNNGHHEWRWKSPAVV